MGSTVFLLLTGLYQLRRLMPLADVAPWDFSALFAKGYGTLALLVLFPTLMALWGIIRGDPTRQEKGSMWLLFQSVCWAVVGLVVLFQGEFVAALLMPWHLTLVSAILMTPTTGPREEAPVPPSTPLQPPTVRPAAPEDRAAVASLQSAAVARRPSLFALEPGAEWDERHPVLVAEEDGRVIGCASTSAYSLRECYAGVADFHVFVAKEARGRNVDTLLLESLMKAAEARGIHKLTTCVLAGNTHALERFEKLGFTRVGVHAKHAELNGTRHDVVVVEKVLSASVR
ncbi:GNAT family N-acetyltransferase [Corallococcus silvisoli]|uniref:GNAT family N-acetyltransferase n=1 Tax=Corallococcus silvisoli TaxID=2697031 RepID=UPI001376F15D|nr:GNAT family N-acetyltransferase [Corallococcus silvisoli]NBD12720.1 GNAT family N-acetyltransferase [Corallococcus silvisoli]